MNPIADKEWRKELGISDWKPPAFFASKTDIDVLGTAAPQAHALRRAFDRLGLDGIICLQNNPVAYFKEVDSIDPEQIFALHRQFWNQGLAPILVLIDQQHVHVYSGLTLPANTATEFSIKDDCLVQRLNRIADEAEIRQLVLSIESGEFFRVHSKSFDPKQRVDRELLRNLQQTRKALAAAATGRKLESQILDALLCRIVFVCYLFDRNVIGSTYLDSLGISTTPHLRDILKGTKKYAKAQLYTLFKQLGADFNGDLFSDDLDEESRRITAKHLEVLDQFLQGTDVMTGQRSFWPYDFEMIPIETISAIYEHFLKAEDPESKRDAGAFYTPRFLAEVTLDIALHGVGTLLNKRFLDPACGSGIFLVGIFNRLAEEWKRNNPNARYDQRASALIELLRKNISGVDVNPTACRIAAFSLYLALLDQLTPPDIQELQRKGNMLPKLISSAGADGINADGYTILCGDFFSKDSSVAKDFDLVVGNPPWKSLEGPLATAESWCLENVCPIANRQLAIAFIWKAAVHQRDGGQICLVLPHGVLFNHQEKAVEFQKAWLEKHAIDVVLNLADMRFNLFEAAVGPALIVRYDKSSPASYEHRVKYLVPKTSWSISQVEILSIVPQDRTEFPLVDVLSDLRAGSASRVWKERFWGTPRDWKLLDRLADLPSLSKIVGQHRSRNGFRWTIAEGIQPVGESDDPSQAKTITLPSRLFLSAKEIARKLVLKQNDCEKLPQAKFRVRSRSNTNTEVFKGPHVLVSKGLNVAFADFSVAFRHAVRGIRGPRADRDLLLFLTVYLRSPIARYFLFHTSSRWGVERAEVEVAELLRVPFLLPDNAQSPHKARSILSDIVRKVDAFARAEPPVLDDRARRTQQLQRDCDALLYDYFSIDDVERMLMEDTENVVIQSILPRRASSKLPTLKESSAEYRKVYTNLLCETLNDWAREGAYRLRGSVHISRASGVAAVILDRTKADLGAKVPIHEQNGLPSVLDHLQKTFGKQLGSVELLRGVKVFNKDTLYIFKPLAQRYWTRTAALNDADDIATTVLLRSRKERS
jgi:hypothetical protein